MASTLNAAEPTPLDEKLVRLQRANAQLRQELDRPAVPVSEASKSLIQACMSAPEPLLQRPSGKQGPATDKGCCTVT